MKAPIYLLLVIVAYFIAFSSIMVFLVPPCEGPDEIAHIDYINYVARYGEAPDLLDEPSRRTERGWERHQPPLYYALCAALPALVKADRTIDFRSAPLPQEPQAQNLRSYLPDFSRAGGDIFASNADRLIFYGLRFLSVALGALTLFYIAKLSRRAIGDSRWVFFPPLFVATLPQFAFVSAILNNDNLANLLAAAALYYAFQLLREPGVRRNYLVLGCVLGLGLLTKKTLVFLVPGVGAALVYSLWANRAERWRVVSGGLLCAGLAVLLSGGWFLRTRRLYGGDWLGVQMERKVFVGLLMEKPLISEYFLGSFWIQLLNDLGAPSAYVVPALALTALVLAAILAHRLPWRPGRCKRPFFLVLGVGVSVAAIFFQHLVVGRFVGVFFWELFQSFVGVFGLLTLRLPGPFYDGYALLMGLAAVGLLHHLIQGRFRDVDVIVGCGFVGLCMAGIIYYNLTYSQPQGRFIFPVLSLIALLLGRGLGTLLAGANYTSLKQCVVIAIFWLFVLADVASIARMYAFWKPA